MFEKANIYSWPFADDVDHQFFAKEINHCYKKLINALFLRLLGSGMSGIQSPDLKLINKFKLL